MVGTPQEILSYLQQVYPGRVIAVIVWTRSEVRDVAERHGFTLTDEEADSILYDLARNEDHVYGENEQSVYGYICALKNVEPENYIC
ncbi:hypothetical protein C3D80_21950 [Cronobacter sakazakii]|uniref:DUF1380 family protein n=1 Tax=Cronobacter sakazakii TaxID=28141 RepID=UPI0009BC1411|nr:DUF1380 family protein [Cronobacter sakazakii]MDK1225378.1 DUF1380 family protein [Cronobacter turicensis]EJJ0671769.1 DUF1380 family protein [Cronobacter sakazakii]EMC4401909.1 DUF1380 family protein [Cronobacter sakazakii]KAB0805728.1 DUF1380 domain-containing protein [Cronobacter sakazakii]KAB0887699.1 DUF1380 domain-containing protein [Cronobacter sakazakii]